MMTTSNYIEHANIDFAKAIKETYRKSRPNLLDGSELQEALSKAKIEEQRCRTKKNQLIADRNNGKVSQKMVALADKNLLLAIEKRKSIEQEIAKRSAKHSDISEEYLAHHGRLGQKWGKKNGPPYPLDFKKLSPEEKEKAKQDTIRKGDIQTAHRNRDHYTDQELKAVKERFKLNQEVSQINNSLIKTGADKAENAINNMKRFSDNVEKLGKIYNVGLKVANTFGLGADLPKYDYAKKDDKNKNDKKD